jgi:GAF domain-containing protein
MSEAAGTSPIRLSQELTIFHDVAKALTSSLNLDSILQTIMEKMAEYFRPDTWSLLMVDEEKDELYFAIAVGAAAEVLSKERLKVGEGIAGWVARHGQLLIVPNVEGDARFSSRLDEITQVKTRSVICVPLRSKHRVLGVIQLVNANVEMSEQEIFFLQALCDYAAISIENARAVEKIARVCLMRGICIRRWKPRCIVPRASATNSACSLSIWTTSRRSTTLMGIWWEAGCWPRSAI